MFVTSIADQISILIAVSRSAPGKKEGAHSHLPGTLYKLLILLSR